jgi:hypothetical protein
MPFVGQLKAALSPSANWGWLMLLTRHHDLKSVGGGGACGGCHDDIYTFTNTRILPGIAPYNLRKYVLVPVKFIIVLI